MVAVVVERACEKPVSLKALFRADTQGREFLDAHHTQARFHAVSASGMQTLCVYEAPDAEVLRHFTDQAGLTPASTIWAATAHAGTGDDTAMPPVLQSWEASLGFVTHSFEEVVDFDAIQAEHPASPCQMINRVRFVRSYLSLGKRRMVCLFAAPDLEAIRTASRASSLPCDGIFCVGVQE